MSTLYNIRGLTAKLREIHADPMMYSVGAFGDEQYCIEERRDGTWETYLGERGQKTDLLVWASEDAACRGFFGQIAWLHWH